MATHNELGIKGEKLALDFLKKKDFTILERNYRYLKAEVDIIAAKNNLIVAIEVKTRTNRYFGNPQDFISPKKIKLITTAMDYYVVQKDLDVEVRFDIIAIVSNQKETHIEHLENAFLYF